MLKISKKLVLNYYLCLALVVLAQAFFTVLIGNQRISQNSQLASYQGQKESLEKQLRDLDNEIAHNQSMLNHKNIEITDGYIDINARQIVSQKADTQILTLATN